MLVIGNVYGHGFSFEAIAAVERAGFTLRDPTSRYAGSQVCHFVDFEDGPALELIEVEDPKAYLDFVPNGMTPYAPGISLVVPPWAERDLSDFERRNEAFRPYRVHAAYDGSDDASRPGWNYLNFARALVPRVFIWLTQLDEPVPRHPVAPRHPNGAFGVRGLVFNGDDETLRHVARIAETPMDRGSVTIEGVTLWPRTALGDVPRIRGKAFPLLAVVVETADLGQVPREVRRAGETTLENAPALRLRTNDLSWDLLLVEGDPDRAPQRFPTPAAETPRYVRPPTGRSRSAHRL